MKWLLAALILIAVGAPLIIGTAAVVKKKPPQPRPAPYAFEFCQEGQVIWPGCIGAK